MVCFASVGLAQEQPLVLRNVSSGAAEEICSTNVILLNERHFKRLMAEYVRYYHDDRTHLGLEKQTPAGREEVRDPGSRCRVVATLRLGGLHHRYDLAA
jgi:hypothetical protein